MRTRRTLAVFSTATLILVFSWLLAVPSLAQSPFDADGEKQLIELINQERARADLQPLATDQRLTQAARKHTALMVKHKALSHQFDDEESLQLRTAEENIRFDRQAENVALEMDVTGAHAILMNSPPHRANILSPDYNAIGVGVMRSGDEVYVTEDFAHRLPDYSQPEADAELQKTIAKYASCAGAPGSGPQAPERDPSDGLRHGAH